MGYKSAYPMRYPQEGLTGPYIIEEIYRQTKGEAVISTEVGQHQMWAAQYYKYTKPRTPSDLRRTGYDGIWSWGCDRSKMRQSG